MGGSGKTPTALALLRMLKDKGYKPAFLTRGYKGRLKNVIVDTKAHTPADVGDEPLLLAREALTVVAKNRVKGAQMAEQHGATAIIMDDGFQNPRLFKDRSVLVFDGGYGVGNNKVFPAGPLRERLEDAIKRADMALIIGEDKTGITTRLWEIPLFAGEFIIDDEVVVQLVDRDIVAFAGIGRPEKFFDSVRYVGARTVKTFAFTDHYDYSDKDIDMLKAEARRRKAVLVTTSKDAVKLAGRLKDVIVATGSIRIADADELQKVLGI
jgi:tetraacyldisaccharide 4'-kinase